MEQTILATLAQQVATPGYIFDTDLFRDRVGLVRKAFGEKVGLCFSIKANPFLLKFLPEEFDKIEVCSPGELSVCERIGADLSKIIFSGVNKTKKDVERAIDDGVDVLTVESALHLRLIHEAAAERGKTVSVLLRLTAGSQFGMDKAEVLQIIENREAYPHTEIVGIHFFSGTQKRKAAAIIKELDKLLAFFEEVEQLGFHLQRLEYGTGLAVDYFAADADDAEAARLEAISEKIREVGEKTELTVEMGRFFAAPCGYYVTRVMDTKTCEGIHYAIVDGGLNQLKYDGQIQGMQIPVITQVPEKFDAETQPWTLCGSLCTTADILARNAMLQGLQIGDTLVFHRTGAYSVSEGMALFLSRELPEVNVYSAETGLQQLRPLMDASRFNTPCDMDLFGRVLL